MSVLKLDKARPRSFLVCMDVRLQWGRSKFFLGAARDGSCPNRILDSMRKFLSIIMNRSF